MMPHTDPKIKLGFEQLAKALKSLDIVLQKPMDQDHTLRDATIHRFEFTFELYWKLLKRIILTLGKEVNYPKEVLREAYAGKLIQDENVWLEMLIDRNSTSHTYNEDEAQKIYLHIQKYYPIMKATFDMLFKKFQ